MTPLAEERCCCRREHATICTSCGRALCGWHSALSPVMVDEAVQLVPVCMPICNSTWWLDSLDKRSRFAEIFDKVVKL
jgi:hypothetical protein